MTHPAEAKQGMMTRIANAAGEHPLVTTAVTGLAALAGYGIKPPSAEAQGVQAPLPSYATGLYTDLTPQSLATIPLDGMFGNRVINSIPGISTDAKPTTEQVTDTPGSVKVTFTCPPARSGSAGLNFRSIEIKPGNVANGETCPSYKTIIFPKLVRSEPTYSKALSEYKNDQFRNIEWQGDYVNKNVFAICKDVPKHISNTPKISVKNNKPKVTFFSGAGFEYCDEIGQHSNEVKLQVRRAGSKTFKNVGRAVMTVGSFPAGLFMHGYNTRYARQTVAVPNEEVICKGQNKKSVLMRSVITTRFTGYQGQHFQHIPEGAAVPSGKVTRTSKPVKVCK